MAVYRLICRWTYICAFVVCLTIFWLLYMSIPTPRVDRFTGASNVVRTTPSLADREKRLRKEMELKIQETEHKLKQEMELKIREIYNKSTKKPPDIVSQQQHSRNTTVTVQVTTLKTISKPKNKTQPKPIKEGHWDKVVAMGNSIRNKTIEIGNQMRNKTIEKLREMGVIERRPPKVKLSQGHALNISISMDELSDFMNVTKYLKNVQSSNVETQTTKEDLIAKVRNFTHNSCQCIAMECHCCRDITIPRLSIFSTGCLNFTFMSKTQMLKLTFSYSNNRELAYNTTLKVSEDIKICLGGYTKAVDLCIFLSNVSYTVDSHAEHKTQLRGCVHYDFNLFSQPVAIFPVGCFKLPEEKHLKKHGHLVRMGNFVV